MLLKPISSQMGSYPLEPRLASITRMDPVLASMYLALKWPGWDSFDIPKLIFCTFS